MYVLNFLIKLSIVSKCVELFSNSTNINFDESNKQEKQMYLKS